MVDEEPGAVQGEHREHFGVGDVGEAQGFLFIDIERRVLKRRLVGIYGVSGVGEGRGFPRD